jgi:methionyl-tRNA synthetase
MSKSLGNVIDPLELIDVYGADAVRFYAARVTTFGQDGNVSVDDVRERYERELANDLGNLVSRTTAMIARYRDGALEATDADSPWDLDGLRETLVSALDRFEITNALDEIWLLVRRLNQYVEESAPWHLAKDEARSAELTAVLYNLADGLTAIAVALAPYLPDSAPRILAALGQPSDDLSLERIRGRTAVPAEGIEPATPLFPRVELPAAAP